MKSLIYKNNRGQLIIEYVLLLAIAAVVSGIIVSRLASRDPDSPGAIITGWSKVIQSIGGDPVDDCLKPSCPN
ncbi:MAG: hypothetical protein JNM24_16080 [Bdellovibrionaceae bacterium]|nr:hypothetical protein [Pseudobdellovibrionaceae bacterium]